MMQLDGCQVLITGASAGIGREFARQLAQRASALVLVARREQRLTQLRAELSALRPTLRVEIHVTDLSKRSAVEELVGWMSRQNLAVDLLINNAGLGDMGGFATSDPDRVDRMMQVNVAALTQLTRGLLPGMIERAHGAILNVSSSAGFLPIPNFAVYAASKAYVTSFSEALRGELHGTGVQVSALCPGPVRTEFQDVARRKTAGPTPREPDLSYVPVEKVVADALKGIERNRPLVIPGAVMKFGMFLVRLTPLAILRLGSRLFAKPVL